MKRNKILASVSTAALALGMLTVIGEKQVNAADNDDPADIVTVVNYTPAKSAVTAVKTSYNAKTKSLTIAGKAKGASKVVVSYNAKALKPVKVTKKGNFKTAVKFTGYKDFNERPLDPGLGSWMYTVCSQQLEEYNAEHPDNPLCEADGTPVSFDY